MWGEEWHERGSWCSFSQEITDERLNQASGNRQQEEEADSKHIEVLKLNRLQNFSKKDGESTLTGFGG